MVVPVLIDQGPFLGQFEGSEVVRLEAFLDLPQDGPVFACSWVLLLRVVNLLRPCGPMSIEIWR
ncbi:hypothetical protein D9M70_511870 [compost metagenome]